MYIYVGTLPYPSCSHTLARAKRAPKRGEERSLTLGERFPQSVHNWTTEWAVYTVERKEKWSLPLEALIKWMDRASGRKRAGLKVERECVKYEIRWNNKPGGFRSGCAFALLLALCAKRKWWGCWTLKKNFSSPFTRVEKNTNSLWTQLTCFEFKFFAREFLRILGERKRGKRIGSSRSYARNSYQWNGGKDGEYLDTFFRVTLYAQVPSCTRVYGLLRTRT